MKRYLILFIIPLFFSAGCSAPKRVDINQPMMSQNLYIEGFGGADCVNPKGEIKKTKNISKPDRLLTRKVDRGVRVAKPLVGEDEDIALLIGKDYYKEFDIPIVFNDAVKYFINYFTTEKRKVFANWLKRSRYYVPIIREILREQGLPEDLIYLSMIESGFNPRAYSPAKAAGPWQFIYETGNRYGLKANYWIDERRDPEKSTVAATKYLRDLFNQFGCWYLAAAGYNSGEGRVERAIEKHNTNDFWEIAKYNTLPRETREYIPKMVAAAIIAKDPERFGFGSIVYDQPVRFVQVAVPPATPLTSIAKSANIEMRELKAINPEILRGMTPPGMNQYVIKLPEGVSPDIFSQNLAVALSGEKRVIGYTNYKVRKGDTLARIQKRHGVSYEDIKLVNGFEDNLRVRAGMVIGIPRFEGQPGQLKVAKNDRGKAVVVRGGKKKANVVKSGRNVKTTGAERGKRTQQAARSYHIVKKGETLTAISSKYGITVAKIKTANNLKSDKVYPNMKLRLVGYTKKKAKKDIKIHVVKKGDTLYSISRKYGIDVKTLKDSNRLKGDKVYLNTKLKIVSN